MTDFDNRGPGSDCWAAADYAVAKGKAGENPTPYIKRMTRLLIATGANLEEIREWVCEVYIEIADEKVEPALDL